MFQGPLLHRCHAGRTGRRVDNYRHELRLLGERPTVTSLLGGGAVLISVALLLVGRGDAGSDSPSAAPDEELEIQNEPRASPAAGR